MSRTFRPEDTPFHKVLQVLEIRAGLTERQIIKRLEIPRSTYRSWKDGASEPSRRVYWRKLAQVFGTPLDQLIFGLGPYENPNRPSDDPRQMTLPFGKGV